MGVAGEKATLDTHGHDIGWDGCVSSYRWVDILPKDGEDVCGYSIKLCRLETV